MTRIMFEALKAPQWFGVEIFYQHQSLCMILRFVDENIQSATG